jgi:uncharacterized tellurite resistance protein B-like protein
MMATARYTDGDEGEQMSEPSAPAAWYPDPSATGVLRWWDGHAWTEHTHVSNPEPAAAVDPPSPASAAPSALTAEAYGTRISFDGQTFTVEATNFAAQGALGAQSRSIQAREITALDLSAPTMLKNGTLAVVTAAGKTLVHYRRKHASGVTAVYNALTGAATRAGTREAAKSAGPSNVLGRNKQTQPAGRSTRPATADHQPAPAHAAPRRAATPTLTTTTVVGPGRDGWVPPGAPVEVAGLTLPGGMLFVGPRLSAANGGGTDPALINPKLRVDLKRPDWTAATVGYWPSYSDITPQARGAYLTWLAGGRREPKAPVSWPFLFFYGLERRVIVDATEPGPVRDEVPLIRAEVVRLLGLYGYNHSFDSYATGFLDLIDFYGTSTDTTNPPERTQDRWHVPAGLRAALGAFAVEGTPVPVDWALAWAHFHPEIYPRTAATRCPAEFEALFRARYASKHGAGLTLRATSSVLTHSYRSASAGIGHAELSTKLPDVFTQAVPSKKLAALFEDCTNALDPYSRYLGRNPDARGTLAATALLPPELVTGAGGELGRLTGFIDQQLAGEVPVLIEGADLIAFWPTKTAGKVAKADAVAVAQLLGAHGVGLEPDVRLGGPVLAAGPTVLFRTVPGQPTAPSPEYSAAAILLHLAVAVSVADGHASDAETVHLRDHIETAMHLTAPEQLRLHAHTTWLLAGQTKLTGLTKRLDLLDDAQRDAIGDFLTMVAAADGVVSPAEITTLTKIFKLLGLDPASVYSRVHAVTTGGLPAAGPVTVRRQSPGAPGYAVPPRPASGTSHLQVVRLDEALIFAKLAETAAVSALLGSIFIDDDQAPSAPPPATANMPLAGLDGPHSELLRTLAARASWSRGELEAECAGLSLLPDGALDTLNEAAYDAVGDPFADGDDPIDINRDVAQEMLA